MKKYNNNNFSRVIAEDSSMRFTKRPRYGTSNSGGNSSPRFIHQNNLGYQFSQNINTTTDCYQPNQYEKSNTNFYGISTQRPKHNYQHQNKQASQYTNKPTISSLSPTSAYTLSSQSVLNLPPTQHVPIAEHNASAAATAPNNQKIISNIMDSSNYYGYSYSNFYPTHYNGDLIAPASSTTYGVGDRINPYLWQTITSIPPPKLPQQQPPLPPQQPPPILPPLPSSENLPHLPLPPPIPASLMHSPSPTTTTKADDKNKCNDQDTAGKTIVKMKAKRKAMSMRYKLSKSWSEKDALLALKAEEANTRKLQKDIILIIRFPDPEISREIVKCYSPDIESVHFQLNFAQRYCLVHLKPATDVEKTIENLSKIPFGTGFLSVEIKQIPYKVHSTKLNEIDPFTLYVGNLPTTIACKTLKEHFPGAARIDIGFAQRMKYTRYAFIRYQNVQLAIEAYKRMLDAEIGGRTLTIRFRRFTAASDGSKDDEVENHDDIHDDLLSQTAVPPDDNSTNLFQTCREDIEQINGLQERIDSDIVEHNSNYLPKVTEPNSTETKKCTDNNSVRKNVSTRNNSTETNNSISPMENAATIPEKSNTLIRSIKPDPDIDPHDIVIRNNSTISRFDVTANNIKQEENNLSMYMEFFEKPNNHNNNSKKSTRSDIVSQTLTEDDTDTISTLSINSLGDFLQTCQRPQTQTNNIENIRLSPTKKNKCCDETLQVKIKREPLENNNVANTNKLVPGSRKTPASSKPSEDSNDDDVVPPSALFFRNNYQNMVSSASNICDYDEFYETRTNVTCQVTDSQANIKVEPSDIPVQKSATGNNKNMLHETLNQDTTTNNIILSKEKSTINSTAISNTVDDDDLVPPENLLGSYRPLQNVIKQEKEHDDIFSIPFKETNRLNAGLSSEDSCNNNNDSVTNLISQPISDKHTSKIVRDDGDEDVIIISSNVKRQSKEIKSNNMVLSNLFFNKQPDLVTFKHKPISVTIPSREVFTLGHRDHLDRLYDQLDADSDNEL